MSMETWIVFAPTGEVRHAREGDWWEFCGRPYYWERDLDSYVMVPILRRLTPAEVAATVVPREQYEQAREMLEAGRGKPRDAMCKGTTP